MPTPLVLVSSEVVTITTPVGTEGITIEDIVIVSPSVPAPTLDDGRPV